MSKVLKDYSDSIPIASEVAFLAEHNGLRPSCMHLIIGTSGGGKSTLFRTLLFDVYQNMIKSDKIGVWFSEESTSDFITQVAGHHASVLIGSEKRVHFFSEQDDIKIGSRKLKLYLEEIMEKSSVFFFDNITTSRLYEGVGIKNQQDFVLELKAMAKKHECALVVFAHADGNFGTNSNRAMEQNDIRGPKTIVNLSEYLYVTQMFISGAEKSSFLRIVKHRGHDIQNSMFKLDYDHATRTYSQIRAVSFNEFNAYYQNRDKLTDKGGKK